MEPGVGTAAGATDIVGAKSRSTGVAGFEKEWVIVPWPRVGTG
jgi:hypothetical protein